MAKPFTLKIAPGLARTAGVDYFVKGRYSEAQLMRWVIEGSIPIIRPMQGWDVQLDSAPLMEGRARAAYAWLDDDELPVAAFGTSTNLYSYETGELLDVTPAGFTPGDPHESTWTLDSFSELGIACNDFDRIIYEIQPGSGGVATPIANAPSAVSILVTDQKILFALGVDGNPRAFAWSDQENLTQWTPTALNQAGDLPVHAVGALVCGTKITGGALLHTTEGVHRAEYIGRPDVYDIEHIANGCGIIGRHASKATPVGAFWMGSGQFFVYKGFVEPVPCDIGDDVFHNINKDYQHKVWCLHLPDFSEVWWFYPRGSAIECSHAAIFNYRKGFWNHTEMPRLAGVDPEVFDYPILASSEGRMMRHETGWDYDESVFLLAADGETRLKSASGVYFTAAPGDAVAAPRPYLRSGPIEMGEGGSRVTVDQFIPAEMNQGGCDTWFGLREYPNATETVIGPYSSSDLVGVLRSGRQFWIEHRAAIGVEDFRIGPWRVLTMDGGEY